MKRIILTAILLTIFSLLFISFNKTIVHAQGACSCDCPGGFGCWCSAACNVGARPCTNVSDCNAAPPPPPASCSCQSIGAGRFCTGGDCGLKAGKNCAADPTICTRLDPGGTCALGSIDTAIGCIPYDNIQNLMTFLLSWALGIGGGLAFLLICVAAFQIMTSSGDPKRLQAGQELLTSAITGLIMLIFSAFILRFIGIDLFGIPGI